MNLTERERFARARRAFEEFADLTPAARQQAIAVLAEADPELGAAVASLFAAEQAAGTSFLAGDVSRLAPTVVEQALVGDETTAGSLAAGDQVGPYRLRGLLGRGGMGEVWEAARADGQFEQLVALKLLRRGLDSADVLARFRRERQILAQLEHPGIARLLDGGITTDGRPYFALERITGEPITSWCGTRNAGLVERLRLLIAVCEAVAAAHRSLVVHRDVKPSNILVDASGQVKLLDFGIAKLLTADDQGADHTRLGERALTPSYAAPEQVLGEPITTATDVYAIGVVACELLSGSLPHDRASGSLAELGQRVERETPQRPSRLAATRGDHALAKTLAGDLDAIVLRALAREPARRYPSVSALAEDLERHLSGQPVMARPDSRLYRSRKFIARHRLAVAASAAALVALVAGLIVVDRSAREARAAANRAERVRGFLLAVFDVADPARTGGEPIAPRTLVDSGVAQVDAELATDPVLRAEMHDIFAGLYRKLGELPAARQLAERALAERTTLFGGDSAAAARSEWTLGWILTNQGEFEVARRHLEHAIEVLDRREGEHSLAAADAREPLMELLFGAEGPTAALPVVERRLATYRRHFGEHHEATARSLSDLGVVYAELGRVEEAERAYRASAATLDQLLADTDPRRALPHSNLAALLHQVDRPAEAEREARAALAIRRASLGPHHPETGVTLAYLTRVLLDLDRLAEAEQTALESVAAFTGRDRFGAAQAQANLGAVYLRLDRPAAALAAHELAISELSAMLPASHVLVCSAQLGRLQALEKLGRRAEVAAELEPLLVSLSALGPGAASTLEAARQLAERVAAAGG